MCGIAGLIHADPHCPATPEAIRAMTDTIRHRGPDAEGVYVHGQVGLGSRRLSIIDLSTGDQPIYSEDRSIVTVFNGEIYNFQELRRALAAAGHRFSTNSDTEIVVHGYEQWGERGLLDRLNGMFGFALWDNQRQRLLLARDRVGIKPLYYAFSSNVFLFASELKAILAYPGLSWRINPLALDAYLTLEYVPTPLSIYEGISKLPPGNFLIWEGGQIRVEPYWDFAIERSERRPCCSVAEYVTELKVLLRQTIEMEMIADVPLGVLLSGGIDSSIVAAIMTQIAPGQVKSFSIGMEDASFDESIYAEAVARHVGTQHHVRRVTPQDLINLIPSVSTLMDEPLADSSIIPTTMLAQFAREHVKVVLGGDGGDELFAGYSTLQAHRVMNWYERLMPGFLRQVVIPEIAARLPTSFANISLDFKIKRFVAGADTSPHIRHQNWLGSFTSAQKQHLLNPEWRLDPDAATRLVEQHLAGCQAQNQYNRVLYQDMKLYLEGDILTKSDRASMSASLELRVPLLNKLLLDFAEQLPHQFKLRGLTTKYVLRCVAQEVAPQIAGRGKKGFNIPVAAWIAGPLREMVCDMLHPDRLVREGYFNPVVVQNLLDDHLSRRCDHRKLLWTVLVFEMWYERWGKLVST